MSIPTIELYVKLEGSPTAVPVYPNPSDTVYKVIKAIKIELPRLANVDNDLLTLHSDPATDPYLPGELIGQLIANLQPPNSGRDPLFVRVHSPVAVPAAATVQSVEHLKHLRHLKAFWIAASQSSTPVEKGRVMGLPDGTYMLGDTTRGVGIFVRNCYPDLCVKTLQLLDEGTPVLLIGNPGIGKTFFGHLLLFELAKRKATVVYVDGSVEREERSYLFKWDESLGEYIVELGQRGNRSQHSSECDKVTTYYICDACTPAPTQARTLMITSPKRSRYHPFTKRHNDGGTVMLYMPIWDLTEIQKCRQEIYCELKEAHVASLFHKWGGIPRWVLHHANNESQQGYLEEVLQQANLESVIASCQAGSANDDTVSHFIIHLMANDKFERLPVVFASDYVETRIFTREFETNQSKLRRFVAVSENEDAFGNIRGNFFEQLAHRDIANGKSFRIRRLKKGLSTPIETITFGARPQFFFENTHHVSNQTADVYFRPRNKRHEAVDSFQRPNNMYQMCHRKNLRHPVTQKGVHEALKYLGNPINPRLYFVVPATKFDNFSEQGYLGTSGKVLKSVDPVIQVVEQYALEIPNE